jgi:twitching motility two-component system response regulator PilH
MASATILVVDDSPTDLKIVSGALQAQGYRILTASNGEEAIDKATREQPALVVLDVVMPKQNGYQVCRALKSAPQTQAIKVVLLTSKNQASDRFWGMKQGADAYLTKPFVDDELLKSIRQLI